MLKKSRDEVHSKNLELQELASHDPLTACLNRRAFFEQFEMQWSNSRRHNYPLAYVMVDIDHFKAVNDKHGHQVVTRCSGKLPPS
jgi:diguanylate cyclase (GGDEF)-like protein